MNSRPRPLKWPIYGLCLLSLGLSWWLAPAFADALESWGYALRVTARVAFVFLLLAMVARPLMQLFKQGRVLLLHRRYLGLSVAFTHTIHFIFVVLVVQADPEPLALPVAILGGGAFAVMWLMALTSNAAGIRRLGPWWSRLHRFGSYYLWIVFMQSFAGRIPITSGVDQVLYSALTLAGLVVLGLRIAAFIKKRRRVPTPA